MMSILAPRLATGSFSLRVMAMSWSISLPNEEKALPRREDVALGGKAAVTLEMGSIVPLTDKRPEALGSGDFSVTWLVKAGSKRP